MTKAGDPPTLNDEPEPTSIRATATPAARFFNQGSFACYEDALRKLSEWVHLAGNSGYAPDALAAWITISDRIRVQLATRTYWKHLTPRGRAREALGDTNRSPFVLCLVFRRGQVEVLTLDELARAHAPLLDLAPLLHAVNGAA